MDPTGSSDVIKFITWFVIILNSVMPCATTSMHCLLYHMIKKSRKVVEKSKSKDDSIRGLICQLIVSDICYFLCWYPAAIIYLLSMFLSVYPAEVASWLVVVVIPINSLTGPSIFLVITMKRFCQKTKENNLRENEKN